MSRTYTVDLAASYSYAAAAASSPYMVEAGARRLRFQRDPAARRRQMAGYYDWPTLTDEQRAPWLAEARSELSRNADQLRAALGEQP